MGIAYDRPLWLFSIKNGSSDYLCIYQYLQLSTNYLHQYKENEILDQGLSDRYIDENHGKIWVKTISFLMLMRFVEVWEDLSSI